MPVTDQHPAAFAVDRLLTDCEVRRGRRSGPGGQHRNKVETAVVITHQPTGIMGQASERRSQRQNHEMAVQRLRVNLALQVRRNSAPDQPTSELWRSRCRGARIRVSASHDDFPAILAEALDTLCAREMDIKSAAQALACSVSQLVKLLKLEQRALEQVNHVRRRQGLAQLK